MQKSTTALATPLREQLDRLAAFEPTEMPVLSLYLNMAKDQHGQEQYGTFFRKTFPERMRTLKGEARKSFERDVERITQHLGAVPKSVNGVAIFACAAQGDFFETVHLDVPVPEHWLFIGSVPHLYPLARLVDQHPRYAALLLDTNAARIFVFGLGATESREAVKNVKTRRTTMGGWSQARYQRHQENFHLHHVKEVVTVLDKVVREERIANIVVACDEVARPTLFEQMPKHLAEKVLDVMKLEMKTPEHEVLAETMTALRERDATTDAEQVQRLLDAWRAGGLGVVGAEETLMSLEIGEVEELLITATPELLQRARVPATLVAPGPVDVETSRANGDVDTERHKLADALVTKAQLSGATLRFIEDPALLDEVGGVGALLRFRARK